MANRGLLPCFSEYCHRHYPIDDVYNSAANIGKVKRLLVALIDSENITQLPDNGIGGQIQTVRPTNGEGRRLYERFGNPHDLYRIDYGNVAFRTFFTVAHKEKTAFILGFDVTHESFSGKNRR